MRGMSLFAGAALLLGGIAGAETISSGTYKVLSVAEGDLITIDAAGKPLEVRLYGADTPEEGQGFHDEARKYTEDQIKGKDVALEAVTQEEGGRPVVVVRVPDAGVLHEDLVSQGLAWWDSVNVPENATLKRLNAKAIGGGLGLFKDAAALAPWDFRKSANLPPVLYLKNETPEPATIPAKEEPKMLQAKGTAKSDENPAYLKSGGAKPAEAPMRMSIVSGTPNIPADLGGGKVDVMGLVAKHQPRILRDESGNALGLTADNISQIPFASQLGFQDGDIATSVNGMPIDSEGAAMGMVEQLKGVKNLNVQVLRNGQPVTLNIAVP